MTDRLSCSGAARIVGSAKPSPIPWGTQTRAAATAIRSWRYHTDSFDAELRRRKRLGDLELLDAGRQTLAEFSREWWRVYAEPKLAPKTLHVYADVWDRHVLQRIGGLELRRITPEVVENLQADLRADGVGDPTIRKTLSLLQGVLTRACRVWVPKSRSRDISEIVRPVSTATGAAAGELSRALRLVAAGPWTREAAQRRCAQAAM